MIVRGLVALAVVAAPAHADELASSPTRPGYEHHDHLFELEGRADLEEDGLVIDGIYMVDGFVAPQLDNRLMTLGLFSLDINVDLSALVSERLGAIHINPVGIHGTSPVNELMDVHSSTGNAAPEDIRLFEAWAEQPIGPATVRAGILSADQEFVVADQSSTLLSATFGMTAQFSYSVANPTYPVGTPGVSARIELDDVVVRAAIYDGSQPNWHGIPTALGPDNLLFGEATLGPIKVGGWRHSSLGSGVYAIADARLDDILGAFARAGYSPDTGLPTYIDAGVRIGPGPFRPHDIISAGIAFAQTEVGAQTLLEATYEAQLAWLTLQPDVQLIMLPERTVGIVATRATIVF